MTTKKMTIGMPSAMDEKRWQAEDDMRTLTRAKEIEADRARMAAAKRIAEQKIKEMQKVVNKPVASKQVKTGRGR
jgi:hypothetical protein